LRGSNRGACGHAEKVATGDVHPCSSLTGSFYGGQDGAHPGFPGYRNGTLICASQRTSWTLQIFTRRCWLESMRLRTSRSSRQRRFRWTTANFTC